MGLAGGPRLDGGGSGLRARPKPKGGFFFEFIFQHQHNFGNSRKCLQGMKNTPKITKLPGKFPELDWSMNNQNKVFGAQEKDFRAF
jgi:hypothetical protein